MGKGWARKPRREPPPIRRRREVLEDSRIRRPVSVFISHNWETERGFYNGLIGQLAKSPIFEMVDNSVPLELALDLGDRRLKETIKTLIGKSDVFILVTETYPIHSKWVSLEVEAAVLSDKPILEVRTDGDLSPTQSDLGWSPHLIIDGRTQDLNDAITELLVRKG